MLIKCDDGGILLCDFDGQLRGNHKSQIQSWGFIDREKGLFRQEYDDRILDKLLTYLISRNIPYAVEKAVANKIEAHKKVIEQNNRHLDVLRDYKEGCIDEKVLSEHKIFLSTLKRRLKDHQVKASLHLYLSENAANFSVPGSGKTTVVISVYERLLSEGVVDALYVIGPLSCFGSWKEEFYQTTGRTPKTTILAGGDKRLRVGNYYNYTENSELYLTSFQTNMIDHEHTKKFFSRVNVLLVIDEAHYMKRLDGEWSNAVLNIAMSATRRVVLTGTPIPKSFSDIFNLVDFLYPEYEYLNDVSRRLLNSYQENNSVDEAKVLIEKNVGPLFYRVRKQELNLKKQVFNAPVIVEMNTYEKILYDAIVTKIIKYSDQDYLKNIDLVSRLIRGRMIRLRQCTSYAKLLSSSIDGYDEDLIEIDSIAKIISDYDNLEVPGKITKLLEMVDEFLSRNQRIIIWSNFIGTIDLIEQTLISKGVYCKKIVGATPVENESVSVEETREQIRNEFVDPESNLNVLLANPAACAESISLHICCNNAIYYDLSYNCAQYLQSLDRIHRVGASENKESYYYILQYRDSIDADILDNLMAKSERMRSIIDDEYEIYNSDMFDDIDEVSAYRRLFDNG